MFVQLEIEYSLLASMCAHVVRVLFYLATFKREYAQTLVHRTGYIVEPLSDTISPLGTLAD